MSTGSIPHAPIAMAGPLTRGDFLMQLYWFSDFLSVPDVRGIAGLSRLTRMALVLGEESGLAREIDPWFTFHGTPSGGIASQDVWSGLLALRAYQVIQPLPSPDPMPEEELSERRYLIDNVIPPPERREYPMPSGFERDVLTNKGTFFAAKREDQTTQRRVEILKQASALSELPLVDLTARALPLLREVGVR